VVIEVEGMCKTAIEQRRIACTCPVAGAPYGAGSGRNRVGGKGKKTLADVLRHSHRRNPEGIKDDGLGVGDNLGRRCREVEGNGKVGKPGSDAGVALRDDVIHGSRLRAIVPVGWGRTQ